MCHFSGKTDKFDFFDPNWLKNRFWGWNFEKLHPDVESAPPRYRVVIFRQSRQLLFFSTKFAQKRILGSEFWNSKPGFGISTSNIWNQHLQYTMSANFQAKQTTLNFQPKFAQKRILWSEFQSSKPGFGISTSNIPWVPIFRQNGQL